MNKSIDFSYTLEETEDLGFNFEEVMRESSKENNPEAIILNMLRKRGLEYKEIDVIQKVIMTRYYVIKSSKRVNTCKTFFGQEKFSNDEWFVIQKLRANSANLKEKDNIPFKEKEPILYEYIMDEILNSSR